MTKLALLHKAAAHRSPLQQIAATLAGMSKRDPWSMAKPIKEESKPISKTDKMRNYLRTEGPANCHTLAMESEVSSTSVVGSLLAGDIEKGRIFMREGKYHWNHEFDERLEMEIRRAISLLNRNGYKVTKL